MYEGSPYSDPNLYLPPAGTAGTAATPDVVVQGAMSGGDVVFYMVLVGALVLVVTLLVLLGPRVEGHS